MGTKIHWVHRFESGARLGIMPRPRGNEWLENEIAHFKKDGVNVCVSLLERAEINELGLSRQKELCSLYSIHYINFPITDRNIPADNTRLSNLIHELTNHIDHITKIRGLKVPDTNEQRSSLRSREKS